MFSPLFYTILLCTVPSTTYYYVVTTEYMLHRSRGEDNPPSFVHKALTELLVYYLCTMYTSMGYY